MRSNEISRYQIILRIHKDTWMIQWHNVHRNQIPLVDICQRIRRSLKVDCWLKTAWCSLLSPSCSILKSMDLTTPDKNYLKWGRKKFNMKLHPFAKVLPGHEVKLGGAGQAHPPLHLHLQQGWRPVDQCIAMRSIFNSNRLAASTLCRS